MSTAKSGLLNRYILLSYELCPKELVIFVRFVFSHIVFISKEI